MVFSYYHKLPAANKRIYQASDKIHELPLPDGKSLHPLLPQLADALEQENRLGAQKICIDLANGIVSRLRIPPVRVTVLAVRPSASWGELHGLYQSEGGGSHPVITLWMRTAKHKRVVAFKAFLRTLLHELCHHADYELFRFPDSFHTEGFYKRESSLFHQLVPGQNPP